MGMQRGSLRKCRHGPWDRAVWGFRQEVIIWFQYFQTGGVQDVVWFFQKFKLEELECLKTPNKIFEIWVLHGNMEFGFQKLMFLNFLFFSPFLDNDMSHVEIKHVAGDKECAIFVF